ncbi:MAG: hypothetical protein AAF616_13150 [Bacteroidota bacterium]
MRETIDTYFKTSDAHLEEVALTLKDTTNSLPLFQQIRKNPSSNQKHKNFQFIIRLDDYMYDNFLPNKLIDEAGFGHRGFIGFQMGKIEGVSKTIAVPWWAISLP